MSGTSQARPKNARFAGRSAKTGYFSEFGVIFQEDQAEFTKISTLRTQRVKKSQDHPLGLKFSSAIENFKRDWGLQGESPMNRSPDAFCINVNYPN